MKDAAPRAIHLSDYAPFPYLVDDVSLQFALSSTATRVVSRIAFRPNPDAPKGTFRLDGEQLNLISARIDGQDVTPELDATGLSCAVPDGPFIWEAEVEVNPAANTSLSGLYMSGGMYCTQCEAEGFRKITYYPDRPDVMAPFTVSIASDLPILLSNGNPTGHGIWHDPWPKPAYLFALVAGDLVAFRDTFTTMSGQTVALNIWVRPGDEGKCDYAMDALKRSMRWDETEYGREYDLDVFNIVAVDDFNMGAMENKGLNIFNSRYVLASPETATDTDYARIEAIIAHEYFHNWTGNRITCRDWFQLCLKEGLTVFRDQQFSGDMRSHPVKRIEDVQLLRARQFREDAGPLAHPVRPESYIEINNFYTATIYEKGAELIRMLRLLVGDDGYAKALDLYFDRHDGDAATIEDWLAVFQDATGRDLTQFKRWYDQAGTPHLTMSEQFEDNRLTVKLTQLTPPTPGQPNKDPQVIPIAFGLLHPDGHELVATQVVEMDDQSMVLTFDTDGTRPVMSLMRNFSAPVIVKRPLSPEDRAFLLANDTDPFNKWEAGRALAKDVLVQMITDDASPGPDFLNALDRVAGDGRLDPAFRALALALPSEDDMAQTLHDASVIPDPMAIHHARHKLARAIAQHLEPTLAQLYDQMAGHGPYTPDAKAAGKRSLRGVALNLLTQLDDGARARAAFETADNMTEELSALTCLLRHGHGDQALATFERRWTDDRLVMDKWFSLQITCAPGDTAPAKARALSAHPAFDWKNPNRFRAVFGALGMSHAGFHAANGDGYDLTAEALIKLDPINPQTTARMTTLFETWRRYDMDRQHLAQAALERVAATPDLSRDTTEMVGRMLNG